MKRRAEDPHGQHKQECVAMFTIDSHNTSYLYRREDNTYYWQHCRKEAEDDLFVDVDGLQLDLFGKPILKNDWILSLSYGNLEYCVDDNNTIDFCGSCDILHNEIRPLLANEISTSHSHDDHASHG